MKTSKLGREHVASLPGQTAHGSDGEQIGVIERVLLDRESRLPEWIVVRRGLLGVRQTPVPLEGASISEDGVHINYSEGEVDDAPEVEAMDELSEVDEERLYSHYGVRPSRDESSTIMPPGGTKLDQERQAPPPRATRKSQKTRTATPTSRAAKVRGPVIRVRRTDRGWRAQAQGSDRAIATGKKSDVVQKARRAARSRRGALVVYKGDGSVQEERTYDRPPALRR